MPAGRPKINRTEEDAKAAQRLSKRLYARRIRSQQAPQRYRETLPPSPPESETSRAVTPSSLLSLSSFGSSALDAVTLQHEDQINMVDLELLHHFTTQTCYALSDKAPAQQIWQITIPQIAYSYPFLMRGLLALSALHLAHLLPHKTTHYRIKAMAHQNNAFAPFREAMKDVSPSNCNAVFAFSAILIIISFASPHSTNGQSVPDVREQTTRWIRLVRGMYPVLNLMWNHLFEGSLRGLFTAGVWDSAAAELPPETCVQYSALFQLCDESEDSETKVACAGALEELRICFVSADISSKNPATSEIATIMSWPYKVSHDYLVALEQGYPIAMIILAYYTTVLYDLNHRWWVTGEPSRILLAVYRLLDKSMRPWLNWPLQVLKIEQEAEGIA